MSASVPTPSPSETAFTGERFLPSCSGEIAYEHWHRYAFARRFAPGKRVLISFESERTRLAAALAAQERVIAYLSTFRGWIGWPWRRVRHWRGRAR